MPLLTKKEFANLCNMPTKSLAIYIQRGKVISKNEYIDANLDANQSFIQKYSVKKEDRVAPIPIIKEKKEVVVKTITPALENYIENILVTQKSEGQSYTESERQLKYLDTLKREKEIERLQIDIDKKKGVVVPSDLIKPIFLQHNQYIITEFKNAADEIIRIFSKKKSLSVNEVAEIKGEMVSCINLSVDKASLASINSIDNIILDYSQTKQVGEHG